MATSIPPHNLAEIVDAAAHLIDNPGAEPSALMDFVSGPDFPTGGVIVDSADAIALAYRTGRGAFRVRARWTIEDQGRGTWNGISPTTAVQLPCAPFSSVQRARTRKLPRPVA